MNKHFFILLVLLIRGFIPSNGRESSKFRRIADLVHGIVSASEKRHTDGYQMNDFECARMSCKLSLNISALAVSQEFLDISDNLESLEVIHARFKGIKVPPTYNRSRHSEAAKAPSITVEKINGTYKKLVLPNSEISFDWDVFDPLWWMWAIDSKHYAFTMPLIDLNILSMGVYTLSANKKIFIIIL